MSRDTYTYHHIQRYCAISTLPVTPCHDEICVCALIHQYARIVDGDVWHKKMMWISLHISMHPFIDCLLYRTRSLISTCMVLQYTTSQHLEHFFLLGKTIIAWYEKPWYDTTPHSPANHLDPFSRYQIQECIKTRVKWSTSVPMVNRLTLVRKIVAQQNHLGNVAVGQFTLHLRCTIINHCIPTIVVGYYPQSNWWLVGISLVVDDYPPFTT